MGLAAWHNILVEVNLQFMETSVLFSLSHTLTQPCRASANRTRLADSCNRKKDGDLGLGKGGKTEW